MEKDAVHLCGFCHPHCLDEELIGVHDTTLRRNMLHVIQPAYVILKPSLIGGLVEANHWIDLAAEVGAQGGGPPAPWRATLDSTPLRNGPPTPPSRSA